MPLLTTSILSTSPPSVPFPSAVSPTTSRPPSLLITTSNHSIIPHNQHYGVPLSPSLSTPLQPSTATNGTGAEKNGGGGEALKKRLRKISTPTGGVGNVNVEADRSKRRESMPTSLLGLGNAFSVFTNGGFDKERDRSERRQRGRRSIAIVHSTPSTPTSSSSYPSASTPPPPPGTAEERLKRRKKRKQVALELLSTERSYKTVLDTIDIKYFSPLLKSLNSSVTNSKPRPTLSQLPPPVPSRRILTPGNPFDTGPGGRRKSVYTPKQSFDLISFGTSTEPSQKLSSNEESLDDVPILRRKTVNTIFCNFADILVLAEEMEKRLSRAIPEGSEGGYDEEEEWLVGVAISPLMPFLKGYSLFVQNFETTLQTISALDFSKGGTGVGDKEEAERWTKFVTKVGESGRGSGGLGLAGMLLNVVQRIPRYKLLLSDLRRFTEEDSKDLVGVETALREVEKVAQFVEDQIKQHDLYLRMLNLQASLNLQLLMPGRKLVHEGSVRRQSHKGGEEDILLILLSDILLVKSEGWKDRYAGVNQLELEQVTVVERLGTRPAFEVRSNTTSFIVYPPSAEEGEHWIVTIRNTKDDLLASRLSIAARSTLKNIRRRSDGERALSFSPHVPPVPEIDNEQDYEVEELGTAVLRRRKDTGTGERHSAPTTTEMMKTEIAKRWSDVFSPPTISLGGVAKEEKIGGKEQLKVAEDYSAPIWVPDDRAHKCMVCGAAFGLWRRKHHCRLCGRVVCWSCSKKTFLIPLRKEQQVARSCDACFQDVFEKDDHQPLPRGAIPTISRGTCFNIPSPLVTPANGETPSPLALEPIGDDICESVNNMDLDDSSSR